MLLYIIVRRVWRKSRECCTSNEDHGSPASESLISLESEESKAKEQENAGDEDEEVSLQGTPAPESGSESALQRRQPPPPVNMETLANLRAEPWSDQSGAPENVAPPSLTSARPQPANEDDNNATNSSQASQVEMPPTPRAELSGQMENPASGEVGNTACHSCHDSRLCNVPATPDPASTAKYPTGYPFTLNT